jgi:hypothetical protein
MISKVSCHSAVSTEHTEVKRNVHNSPLYIYILQRQNGSVRKRLKDRVSIPGRKKGLPLRRHGHTWSAHERTSYTVASREFFPKDSTNLSVKLNTQANLVPNTLMQEDVFPCPTRDIFLLGRVSFAT